MLAYSNNEQGDEIAIHGDGIVTNSSFWECTCISNWVQPASQTRCNACGNERSDCPDAREDEVQALIYSTK